MSWLPPNTCEVTRSDGMIKSIRVDVGEMEATDSITHVLRNTVLAVQPIGRSFTEVGYFEELVTWNLSTLSHRLPNVKVVAQEDGETRIKVVGLS